MEEKRVRKRRVKGGKEKWKEDKKISCFSTLKSYGKKTLRNEMSCIFTVNLVYNKFFLVGQATLNRLWLSSNYFYFPKKN